MTNTEKLLNSPEYKFLIKYFKSLNFADREVYANWLAQTYHFVSHSVRLSALGASRCSVDDPLGRRMAAHTAEEDGHHTIARRDIEALGYKIDSFPAFGVTNAFFQSQYYKVLFEHPAHLLGQIILLEHLAAEIGDWMYAVVKSAHGERASNFVRIHAQEDPDHVAKATAAIDKLPEDQQAGVQRNFVQAAEMYFHILRSANEASYAHIAAA